MVTLNFGHVILRGSFWCAQLIPCIVECIMLIGLNIRIVKKALLSFKNTYGEKLTQR